MLTGTVSSGIHRLPLRVYYEDTDFSGHVYHANYLKFCERGRSDFLRVVGVDQNDMIADGAAFVVRHMACDFLRPARFDDLLTIETTPSKLTGARLELSQRVLRGPDLLFAAIVTVAIIDRRGRPMRIAADMAGKFIIPGT